MHSSQSWYRDDPTVTNCTESGAMPAILGDLLQARLEEGRGLPIPILPPTHIDEGGGRSEVDASPTMVKER